jgi:hypothetical protein
MSIQFCLERINTPTGRMVIVTTDEHYLRAVDWEDHVPRMQRLLRRHYGTNASMREVSRPSAARRSLQAYFDGDLDAVACLPTATNGSDFDRKRWLLAHEAVCSAPGRRADTRTKSRSGRDGALHGGAPYSPFPAHWTQALDVMTRRPPC